MADCSDLKKIKTEKREVEFDYAMYLDGKDNHQVCAVNKQKHSLEEATEIAKREFGESCDEKKMVRTDNGYVCRAAFFYGDRKCVTFWKLERAQYIPDEQKERYYLAYVFEMLG